MCRIYNIGAISWPGRWTLLLIALACVCWESILAATGDVDWRKCLRVPQPLAAAFGAYVYTGYVYFKSYCTSFSIRYRRVTRGAGTCHAWLLLFIKQTCDEQFAVSSRIHFSLLVHFWNHSYFRWMPLFVLSNTACSRSEAMCITAIAASSRDVLIEMRL